MFETLAINREETFAKIKTVAKSITKEFVIAIIVAIVYFALAQLNPATALIGASALTFVASIRLTNLLRPLVLKYYGAAGGIAVGSYAVNVASGKVALFGYSMLPMIMLGLSLVVFAVSKLWGRSFWKDITLITVYAAAAGLIVSLNLVTVAALFSTTMWAGALTSAVIYRVLLHVGISIAGYPLLKMFEGNKYEKDISC